MPKNVIAGHRPDAYLGDMKGQRFLYWQDGQFWLGSLEEFPDYLTQGESLKDLKKHLRTCRRRMRPSLRRPTHSGQPGRAFASGQRKLVWSQGSAEFRA